MAGAVKRYAQVSRSNEIHEGYMRGVRGTIYLVKPDKSGNDNRLAYATIVCRFDL